MTKRINKKHDNGGLVMEGDTTESKAQKFAPVAVLTITFLPRSNQVAQIAPHFPAQMAGSDVLHILRRAEETLIAQMAAAELQQKRDEPQGTNDTHPN